MDVSRIFVRRWRASAVFEFRVTKYDPSRRDARGGLIGDDWTSFSDIGKSFSDGLLTQEGYSQVEDAYVTASASFIRESGVPTLSIVGFENHAAANLPFGESTALGASDFGTVVRSLLREEYWCRLESIGGFIHVGWDFYMYIGVQRPCPLAVAETERLGLFVEPFHSPYRDSCA